MRRSYGLDSMALDVLELIIVVANAVTLAVCAVCVLEDLTR